MAETQTRMHMRSKGSRHGLVHNTVDAASSSDSHGMDTLSPIKVLIMLGVSGLFFAGASIFQISGTEQAVYGNLLADTQITPLLVLKQVQDFFAGHLGFLDGIAFAIGFGIQFTLLTVAIPASAAYAILHHRYTRVSSGEMNEGAARIKQWQDTATKVIIGADLITDVLYITQHDSFLNQGHRVFSFFLWFIPWPNLDGPNAGILLIGVLYACLLCYVNIVAIKMFLAYLEIVLLKIRGLA